MSPQTPSSKWWKWKKGRNKNQESLSAVGGGVRVGGIRDKRQF